MRALRTWSVRHARLIEGLWDGFEYVLKVLRPLTRRIPLGLLEGPLKPLERVLKGLMFDCRMCGQCTLSLTGVSCPMNCPKYLRNGPCGGILPGGGCEVAPAMRCVWLDAWDGAARMRKGARIDAIAHPVSHRVTGRSTWAAALHDDHKQPAWPGTGQAALDDAAKAPLSGLHKILRSGEFAVTAEFNAPDWPAAAAILAGARPLAGLCDAVNVTDNAGANVHIAPISVCAILAANGFEAAMQVTCRDRNRLAIQADVVGASALGIRNIVCMTGDAITSGDHADAKPVFDLDASSLLQCVRHLRDEGRYLTGRELAEPPIFLLGATANPNAHSIGIEIKKTAKKIRAGAQFLQTQFCFDLDTLNEFLGQYEAEGLAERAKLLIGVGPLNSAKSGRWMIGNIPGIRIPEAVLGRMRAAPGQAAEGIKIAVEFIERLKDLKSAAVAGVHVMAIGHPEKVARIVEEARIGPKFGARGAG